MNKPKVTKEDLITILAEHATLSARFGLDTVVVTHEPSGRTSSYLSVQPGVDAARRVWRRMTVYQLKLEMAKHQVKWCWVVNTYEQYEGLLDVAMFHCGSKPEAYEYARIDPKHDRPEIQILRNF